MGEAVQDLGHSNHTMLNLALVGLGFMAATHIKALRQVPGARVAALCNPSGRHLDGDFTGVAGNVGDNAPIKLEPGSFKPFRDYAAMLADPDIHAVDICASVGAHSSAPPSPPTAPSAVAAKASSA